MNIEGINGQRRVALSEPIKINISHDEAAGAAISVLKYPLQVGLDRNGGLCQAMKG